jgi:hypothetical protein
LPLRRLRGLVPAKVPMAQTPDAFTVIVTLTAK